MAVAQIPTIEPHQFGPRRVRGAYVWGVQFRLPVPAARDGFIIQEVVQTEDGADASGRRTRFDAHYYEAWPVSLGKVSPTGSGAQQTIAQFMISQGLTTVPSGAEYQLPRNDIFFRTFPQGNVGWRIVRALAGFYEEPLPPDFIVGGVPSAGALPATLARPSFFEDRGLSRLLWFEYDYSVDRAASNATLRTMLTWDGKLGFGDLNPDVSRLTTH
jgi:hypothetical protein